MHQFVSCHESILDVCATVNFKQHRLEAVCSPAEDKLFEKYAEQLPVLYQAGGGGQCPFMALRLLTRTHPFQTARGDVWGHVSRKATRWTCSK